MATALTVFLFGIFTYECNLCVFVSEESPQSYEIKVGGHEEYRVTGIILIDLFPQLLSEEAKPGVIHVFQGFHIG